jgi:hypothetical protein
MKIKFNRMLNVEYWQDNEKVINFLSELLSKGSISLVLGAGISKQFNLPEWEDLVENLYKLKGLTRNRSLSIIKQIEVFKLQHCKNYSEYLENVRNSLYDGKNFDFYVLKDISTLSAIGSIVMASSRGHVANVITFNFDDILELYLKYHGFYTHSVHDLDIWSTNCDVNVIHPHGFLPHNKGQSTSKEIVFDQSSYSVFVGDESNWRRQLVLSIMRSHFCIFIGLSGDDNNLDSFLLKAKEEHASIINNVPFWGLTFLRNASGDHILLWEQRGIKVINIENWEPDIAIFLFSICQGSINF